MYSKVVACLSFLACTVAWSDPSALAQEKQLKGTPSPGQKERVSAIERFIEGKNAESVQKFMDEHFSPALKASKTLDQWLAELNELRKLYRGFGGVLVMRTPNGELSIGFTDCPGEGVPLLVRIDEKPPHLLTELKKGERKGAPPSEPKATIPPITWENLRERLKDEETKGFSGSVLIARNGDVFLHEGYGLAHRSKNIPNKPETVFAIGSTPIDFTKGAIFKLQDMGKLKMTDTIDKFVPNVPGDKKPITIQQLMTGRSGLQNFLGSPEDVHPDNTWIDRETALKRILGSELLFPPGTDHAHSHAAFGLLAAIVEFVSGDSYIAFLNKNMFEPAGMKSTFHYEDIRADDKDVAIGYEGHDYGSINSPKHWGKTSWLVLGSGGMASTTGDLYRWNKAMRDGKLLSPDAAKAYFAQSRGVLVGGNMQGFFTAYTLGGDSTFCLCTNVLNHERTKPLVDALSALVNGPQFRIGVMLNIENEKVLVGEVTPGSPAQKAGLQGGDQIIAINGKTVADDAGADTLRSETSTGKPVEMKIKRGGETLTITVTPVKG